MYRSTSSYEYLMPLLVGKNLFEGMQLATDYDLNVRIHNYKVDEQLPQGTILWQSPAAGQKIKHQQIVLCTLSSLPARKLIPNFHNKSIAQIHQTLTEQQLTARIYSIKQPGSSTCFAQHPSANSSCTQQPIIMYVADPDSCKIIVPNFSHASVSAVASFLKNYAIKLDIIHEKKDMPDHICTTCKVKAQKPIAGSILSLSHINSIQLQVS